MPYSDVLREATRLAGLALGGGLIGWLLGGVLPGIALALLAYGGWHINQAAKMLAWLARDDDAAPPESAGIWAGLFDRLYHRQRLARQEREELKFAAQTVQEATALMSDAVVMLDDTGGIVWCNAMAARLLGIHGPQDAGQLLVNLFRDPEFVQYWQRGDFSEVLEVQAPRKLSMYLRIEITRFGKGRHMLYARDISKIKRLEKMRVDFIANVSHELRTPLTVINGYLETLRGLEGVDREAIIDRALPQMLAQSARMEALVSDLTMLSRLESVPSPPTRQSIDVVALVAGLIDDLKNTVGRETCFDLNITEGVRLLGQEKEIHSAFGNLLNNACKYSGGGGQITVAWRLEQHGAVFAVSDNGEGISAEHIPRLTERFYRVDKSRSVATGGTGLGLAIVKHVLMRHQARLEIISEPDKGSTFRCVFPSDRLESV